MVVGLFICNAFITLDIVIECIPFYYINIKVLLYIILYILLYIIYYYNAKVEIGFQLL